MASNTKITRIETNTAQETVGFFNGLRIIRIVSIVKEASINIAGDKIIIQSSGLPSFEFDVFSIVDIDGTTYSALSPTAGAGSQAYQDRLSDILDELYMIFKGCCSSAGGGGQAEIQWQEEGANVGTAGQYTNINITGGATATEISPDTLEINVTGGPSSGQTNIQFEDEGVHLGTSGTANAFDVVGELHKATRSGNKITLTAPNVGENLQMTGFDPSNHLNVQIGALITNAVVWSPAAGVYNNLSITGWSDAWDGATGTGKATLISYEGASYAILSGITGGSTGRRMIIQNNSNELLILQNENTSSVAGNRFSFDDGLAMFLMPNRNVEFIYSGSRWRSIGARKFDLFDDFVASNNLGGTFNGVAFSSFYAFGNASWGTAAPAQSSNQLGSISASPALVARNGISTLLNSGYTGSGTNVPFLAAYKLMFSSTPANTKRIAVGFGNATASAGAYYTSQVLQCGFGYAADSGVANAATNWFIYAGAGGAVNIAANGLDTGIPVSQAVNNFCVFVVYFNPTTGGLKTFYSSDRMSYSFAGTRIGTPASLGFALWYEAFTTALPTLYVDYLGLSTKIDTNR